ncbi:hypothetical protein B7P43_G04380 [Cryptotermes secundus]|uniref:Uncharacterized protein n=1 Tax=Cryptotermes secundus TaxID=105785 RepID=A0A2J7QC61_9NEOP|nr:hypothetical protein B7P43_G04380 [Cryptotermes secundus]
MEQWCIIWVADDIFFDHSEEPAPCYSMNYTAVTERSPKDGGEDDTVAFPFLPNFSDLCQSSQSTYHV